MRNDGSRPRSSSVPGLTSMRVSMPGRAGPAGVLGGAGASGWTGRQPWDQVLDWSNPPFAKWFVGGELNVAYNCLDRHVEAGRGDRVAYHWEGEPGDTRTITYAELNGEVCQAANALTRAGRPQGRPGRDLHADDPGDGRRDAGVRAARARRTRSCSAGSPPRRCGRGSSTATRTLVITADGGYRRGAASRAEARGRRGGRCSART